MEVSNATPRCARDFERRVSKVVGFQSLKRTSTRGNIIVTTQVLACKAAILELGSNTHQYQTQLLSHLPLPIHPRIIGANEKFSTPVNGRLTFIHKMPKIP